MLRLFLSFLLIFLATSSVHADFDKKEWAYFKSIKPISITQEKLVKFYLDGEVYANCCANLADLRIIDNFENEVPYQLTIERETRKTKMYYPRILNNSFVPNSHSVFILDLGEKGIIHNKIEIKIQDRNFIRWVEIEGSNDQAHWYKLQTKGFIYDHTIREAKLKAQQTSIVYPETNYRFLKTIIWNERKKPLKILGSELLYLQKKKPAKEINYPLTVTETTVNKKMKANIFILDLGKEKLPSNRIVIESPEKNFHRYGQISGSDDRKDWTYSGEGNIFSYQTTRFSKRKNFFSYPEIRFRYLKLALYHYDNPPLPVKELKVYGIARKISFLYHPQRTYSLYYGKDDSSSPRYDLGYLIPYLQADLLTLKLTSQQVNPKFKPRLFLKFWERNQRYFLWWAMGIIVLILGLIVLRLMRQTD